MVRAAQGDVRRAASSSLTAGIGAAGVVAVGLLLFVGTPWATNDTLWALVWGRQLADGELPTYGISQSSTPHPLTNVLAALASVLGGEPAYWLLAGLALVAFGLVVVLTFAIAREYFGVLAGLVAAVVIATSPSYISAGGSAQMDLVFVAMVLVALWLALRGRDASAMGTLALAGTMHPEAWVLSVVYLAWLWSRRREREVWPGVVVLAGAGPVLWLGADLLVTGHPLYALTYTQQEAEALRRTTGLRHVPGTAHTGLENLLTTPVFVVGALGFLMALATRCALPVVALGAVTGLTYVGYGVAGASLLDRYLFIPAVVLAIAFGHALTRWTRLHGSSRAVWAAAAAAAVAYAATASGGRVADIRFEKVRIKSSAAQVSDLKRISSMPRTRALLRSCGRLLVRDNRPVALLALVTGRDPGDVEDARYARPSPEDVFVTATGRAIAGNKLALFPDVRTAARPPQSFRVAFHDARWQLSTAGGVSRFGRGRSCTASS